MGYDIGPKIGIEGEKEFRKAITDLNTSYKTLGTEMSAVASQFDKNDRSSKALAAQNGVLNSQIEIQKQKLEQLNLGLAQSASKYGDNDKVTKGWQQSVNKATDDLNNLERQLGQNSDAIKNYGANQIQAAKDSDELKLAQDKLKGAFDIAKIAFLAVGASMAAFTMQAMDSADELQALSDKTGLTAERLQELKYAGDNLGVELSTITGAQAKLTKSMSAATDETKGTGAAFARLGVHVRDSVTGELKDAKTVMTATFDALNGVGNETERDALAMQLFGKSAMELNPMIKAGGEELNKLAKEARKSGAVMSNEAVAGLDTFGDALGNMKTSLVGKFGEAFSELAPMLTEYSDQIKSIDTSPLVDGLEWVIDNGEEIAKVTLAIGATFAAWNIAGVVAPAVIAMKEMVTAIRAAETAQIAFNAVVAMSPVGAMTLGITGAILAVGALAIATSGTDSEIKKLISTVEEDKQAWADLQAQQAINAEANTAEIDHTQALWKELQTLVGANGEVLGSKERVKYITEEMNKLAPGAIQWINGETLAYQQTADAIDNLIAKKRAQIILESQEPLYKTAILELGKKEQEQTALSIEMVKQEQKVKEAQAKFLDEGVQANAYRVKAEVDNLALLQGEYAKNESTLGGYYSTIESYEAGSAAVTSDNFEKIKAINTGTVTSHKDATNGTLEELRKQAVNAEVNALLMRERYHSGVKGVTADMVKTAEDAATTANIEYEKIGGNIVEGTKKGVNNKKGGLVTTITDMAKDAVKAAKKALDIHSPSRVFTEIGENVGQGLVNGIEGSRQIVAQSAKVIGQVLIKEEERIQKQIAEMDKAAIEKQQAESTQKYKEELAKKNAELATAEKDGKQKVLDEISKLQSERESTLSENSEKNLKESLNNQLKVVQNFKKEYEDAVESARKDQDNMSKKLADFGALFERTKTEYSESFKIRDLQSDIEQITEYGKALEELKAKGAPADLLSEVENMGVQDGLDFAKNLVTMTDENYTEYIAKWTEKQEAAKKVAQQFYSSELENLKTEFVDKIPTELSAVKDEMRGIGVNAGRGLASGFQSQSEHIKDTFVGVLENALAEAKKSMDIHSPSRKWAEVGTFMAAGLGVGFTSQMQGVVKQINDSIPANVTMTGQYRATAKMGEGIVNGLAGIMPQQNSQPIIVQTILDGKVIAQSLYDPLQGVAKQRGV